MATATISQQTVNNVQNVSTTAYKIWDLITNGNGSGTAIDNTSAILNAVDIWITTMQVIKGDSFGLSAAGYVASSAAMDASLADLALKASNYQNNPSLDNTNAVIQSVAGTVTSFGGMVAAIGTGGDNPPMIGVGLGLQGIGMAIKEANKNYDKIPPEFWNPIFGLYNSLDQSISGASPSNTPLTIEIIGAGSIAQNVTITASNGNTTTNIKTLSASGTIISEQLAVTDSILNLTQVSNFANGQFIGGGIIEGQATLSQLNQEATLASSFSQSMSLARAQDPFLAALNVQSNGGITQGFELADQTATSNAISATVYAGGISEANFVSGQAATDNVNGLSDSRLQNIKADLSADPTALALEDGVLAVKLAQQNPSTLNVLTALQKVLLAGNTLSTEFLATTATLLNSTPSDVNNLIINGGATLNSIIAAYQNPTPISVAAAAMKLLQTNIPITNEMKVATARALGLNTTDLTDMNNLLAYGGAGLAVVAALKNPTPQNIVQSSQQVVSAISYITKDAGKYSQLIESLKNANIVLDLLDFAKNPSPNTALSATLSIASAMKWIGPEFMAVLIIAEAILPGPTTKIINEVYNTANSILNNIAAAANGIMSAVSSVMTSVLDPIANFFSSLFGPLALNLTGGNVHTTNLAVAGAPLFDINGDGTQVQTGWIAPNEGFLVRDLNGDGQINSVKEMFSERNSTVGKSAFGTLAELDGNLDGKIDKIDRAWNDLKIWVDKNGDGISQANELYTLEQLGIASNDAVWRCVA